MSSFMGAELERLARVAVGHGRDDPAIDVFLAFVGALDPLPDAGTLKPAAMQIGKLRLAQALDRPGEPRLGACRLLAAASAEQQRVVVSSLPELNEEAVGVVRRERLDRPISSGVGTAGRTGGGPPGTATVERPVETGRRVPELVEALVHAIRGALSLFA